MSWCRKTAAGSYFLHSHPLQNVTSTKYLWVKISSDLRWDSHIAEATSRANRTLGFVKRNLSICSRRAKVAAYKTLVRSLLEYAGPLSDPYTVSCIACLEKVQSCAPYRREGATTALYTWIFVERRSE